MWEKVQQGIIYLRLALELVPLVMGLIRAVELPGNGAEKLAAVQALVKEAWLLVPEEVKKLIGVEKLETFVARVVSILVNLLNKAGVFRSADG